MIVQRDMQDEEAQLVFTGIVVSGRGEGRFFTRLDWVREQFRARFGFEPVAGTFNVKLGPASAAPLEALKRRAGIAIEPPNADFCAAKCFHARVGSIDGVLVIPLVPAYPPDVLEIVAAVNLREAVGVRDNDPVEVRVTPSAGGPSNP